MESNQESTSNKKGTPKIAFMLYIGFFAGLIWGGLKIVEFGLKLTKISPGFLIEPFYKHTFLNTWLGILLGWGAFIAFSMIAASLYMLLLWNLKGAWYGICYGVAWWGVIYMAVGPFIGMTPTLQKLELSSLISDLGIFILWGLFIGYSISFEYTDDRLREPEPIIGQ